MTGATHSHNPEYPDDTWNLYSLLDASTTSLNVTSSSDTIGVFKPHALRLTPSPCLISDADAEIIVIARFISPVHIRKIMVIGGENQEQHPSRLKCYVNQEVFDFSSVSSVAAVQEFNVPINERGLQELITTIHPFNNVTSLVLYFSENHGGGDVTTIRYIGLQGEHTHYRREAVNAVYEVLCTGQDIDVHTEGENVGSGVGHLH